VHKPGAAQALRNGSNSAIPVTAFSQQFTFNTNFFCTGSPNLPCDGAAGDYGTLDRVASGFSNGGGGNYAPSTSALFKGYFALTDGTGDGNQSAVPGNQAAGCPGTTPTFNPGENCSGPFALFGSGANAGVENVFPSNGFTVTSDLYLSPSTAGPAGSLVDDDVELNNNAGTYGIDNIITACYEQGGFVINFGNGSPGSCSGSPVVTTDGWYRFVFVFSNTAGHVFVTENVVSETDPSTSIASNGPQPIASGAAGATSAWGGPGYFWLPTQDFSGLPLANFALQLGQHINGHTP
jgi:hypothetical protein